MKPMVILGIEVLLSLASADHASICSRELNDYLRSQYNDFFIEKIKVPFLAGGPDVLSRHYSSFRTIYLGKMPDTISIHLQAKLRVAMIILVATYFVMLATLIYVLSSATVS